jgi:hypothetical protein
MPIEHAVPWSYITTAHWQSRHRSPSLKNHSILINIMIQIVSAPKLLSFGQSTNERGKVPCVSCGRTLILLQERAYVRKKKRMLPMRKNIRDWWQRFRARREEKRKRMKERRNGEKRGRNKVFVYYIYINDTPIVSRTGYD